MLQFTKPCFCVIKLFSLQKNRCRYYSSGLLSNFDKYQTRTEKKPIQKAKPTTVKHKHKVYYINYTNLLIIDYTICQFLFTEL